MSNGFIVALCDGHGMETAGKRTSVFPKGHKYEGRFMHENEFNRAVVKLLGAHLERCGFKTLYVAPTDADTPLKTRTDLANNTIKNQYNRPADIYVSVHANALNGVWGSHGGAETLWTKRIDEPLAKIVHKHITKGTPLRDRGCKPANLHVCRETNMPAVLVEACFMDNLKEAELLLDDNFRKECALEIAQAVCEYFKVPFIKETVSDPYNKLVKEKMFNTDIYFYKFKQSDIELKYVKENGLTVSQIRKKYNADLAINANYITGIHNIGNSKIGDKVLSTAYGKTLKWNSFGYKDGKIHIGKLNFIDKWDFLFQSSPMIIDNGVSVYRDSIKNDETANDIAGEDVTPQRTFVIIDKSGDVYFVVSDGRPPSNSVGLTIDNIEKFAFTKNAQKCFNFDGGSSTSMSDKNGAIGQNSGSKETPVHHALLVFIKNPVNSANKVEVVIKVNGEVVGKGLIIDNSTYVPLRSLGEFLGAVVSWDDKTRIAYLNSIPVTGEGVKLVDGVTYVGVRRFGELLGVKVDWDSVYREVLITKNKQTKGDVFYV